MSRKIWEINGLSLELDLDDADKMERYEKAFDTMSKEENALAKDGKASERIRAYCQLFRDLFSRIFDEKTADKLFEGVPVSTSAYDEIYISFLDFVKEQAAATAQARQARLSKYRPNRQQKRGTAKRKK